MKTGVFLLEMLKARWPALRLLALTNVQNEETLQELRRVAPGMTVLHKAHCPPFDLADAVQELIGSPK